jgi:DNA gyrase subunit A
LGKQNKNNRNDIIKDPAIYDTNIENYNIADACTSYMQIFGINNNIQRHIPELYDGLKICERRTLYAMFKHGILPTSPHKKVDAIFGYVTEFHPHGGVSVYDSITRMAQWWINHNVMIDKYGNFGTASGDDAGQSRYIEARLSKFAYKCFFEEFNINIVDMKRNYIGDSWEPEYLPAKYPNVLINNMFGIGYGSFVSIPSYNFTEVCNLTINLVKNPKYKNCILIPDSPTGADIIDDGQFKEISDNGKGVFRMRGVIDIDEEENVLIVRNTPVQVFWESIKVKILGLLRNPEKKINYMARPYKDDSTEDEFNIKIYLKKEINPYKIREEIYQKTDMQKTMAVVFRLVDDYKEEEYNIRSLLLTWIDFRRETKRRWINKILSDKTERKHILEILVNILNEENNQKTMKIFTTSSNKKEIINRLMSMYGISSLQADSISELKGHQYSKEARERYIEELKNIKEEVDKYNLIIRDIKIIDDMIIKELEEGIKLFGKPRKSQIIKLKNEMNEITEHVVVVTNNKNIKKLPTDIKNIGKIENGDFPTNIISCNSNDDLLIFDKGGIIYKIPVSELKESTLNDTGQNIMMYRNMKRQPVTIINRMNQNQYDELISNGKNPEILFLTKNSKLKKTKYDEYLFIKNEIMGLTVKDGDELVDVHIINKPSDIIIYTNMGNGIRINTDEIKSTGRVSVGTNLMSLEPNEYISGMNIIKKKSKYILIITDKGMVKKCLLKYFNSVDRKSTPLKLISLNSDDSIVGLATIKGDEKINIYMKNGLSVLDASEIPELPRLSKGKKMISVPRGDIIINIDIVK